MARGSKKPITRSKKQKAAASDTKRMRRFLFLWMPVIIITLLFIYAVSFDPIESASRGQIEGTLVETSQSSAGNTGNQVYPVKLTNGQIIQLNIFEGGDYKANRRILVEESKTLIFKHRRYRFIRFVD